MMIVMMMIKTQFFDRVLIIAANSTYTRNITPVSPNKVGREHETKLHLTIVISYI